MNRLGGDGTIDLIPKLHQVDRLTLPTPQITLLRRGSRGVDRVSIWQSTMNTASAIPMLVNPVPSNICMRRDQRELDPRPQEANDQR